eukprot:tig00000282_g23840.t1
MNACNRFGSVGYRAVSGFAALLRGRPSEAEKLAAGAAAAAEASDFWMQSTLQFVAGVARWQLRGDPAELAAAARAFLPKWRNDVGAASWLAVLSILSYSRLSIFCCVEYAQWAEADARDRLDCAPFEGGRGKPRLKPLPLLCGGLGPAPGAPSDVAAYGAARAFAREAVAALAETRRRRLPLLAPFCDLAAGSDPCAGPAHAARLLKKARAGFESAGLPFFAALAGVRLSRAELAHGARAEAEAARAQAARTAAALGLVLPALGRIPAAAAAAPTGAEAAAEGRGQETRGRVHFASMWV